MVNEEIKNAMLKDKERSLHINRVPKNTKESFIELAENEFAGDFGMTLKSLFDNFSLWKLLFENVDYKLDDILERISQLEIKEQKPEETKSLRMLSGRRVEKGGKQNGKFE